MSYLNQSWMRQIEKSLEKKNTLEHELICLTSDGYTNKAQVNLVNFEAFTRLGPVHWHTTQRTAAEIWKDAAYVSGVVQEGSRTWRNRKSGWTCLRQQKLNGLCVEDTYGKAWLFCVCALPCSYFYFAVEGYSKDNWIDKVLTQKKEVALFFRSLFIKYSAKSPINDFFWKGKTQT